MKILLTSLFALVSTVTVLAAEPESPFWWPAQKTPARYVVCPQPKNAAEAVLAQSVAGLAARAVGEGRSKRMVWIERDGVCYDTWLRETVRDRRIRGGGSADVWQIVARMKKQGVVKGYVLYASGDGSLNPATVHAGLLDAVLVEQCLVPKAEEVGLQMLYDARGESQQTCWETVGDELNRCLIVVMAPRMPFNRDLAVAHRTMVYYGVDSLYRTMLAGMEPLSPVVGWNSGPESGHVAPPSEYALFNTASDYCSNLTFLSAGAQQARLDKARRVDPRQIDFAALGSCHAFVMSDGDNMQWTMDAFFSKDYYLSPACERFPLNWTTCAANISQMSPATWNEIVQRQAADATLVEFSGGYQYADVFASEFPDRWEQLRRFARQTGEHMRRTGVTVLNLMMLRDIGSEDAMQAYRIYAEEIGDLTGIVAIQYNPYHGGRGTVYWVKNRDEVEIPVVTARYSLWGKIPKPGFGRPDQVAQWIGEDAAAGESLGWTIVHAWSRYAKDDEGAITDADNDDRTAVRGAEAVAWCVDRIGPETRIVSLEELLWRIRMKHDPETTRKIIDNL